MIIFRAGFKTIEEKEYLIHAPHRITSIFPPHDFHRFHSHHTYIIGVQAIFFFWHYSPCWTIASSKSFLHCSVQVVIFFCLWFIFATLCLTLYSFDGRKICVKVGKLLQESGRNLIETLSLQLPERTDGNMWKSKRRQSFYVQTFELGHSKYSLKRCRRKILIHRYLISRIIRV